MAAVRAGRVLNRLLFNDIILLASFHLLMVAFCQLCIVKEIDDDDDDDDCISATCRLTYSHQIISIHICHVFHFTRLEMENVEIRNVSCVSNIEAISSVSAKKRVSELVSK